MTSRRIGLFGGTFNPIHIGHLRLAEDVRERFDLREILFIPVNIPPHKRIDDTAGPEHRLRMVRAALRGNDGFLCDDVEIRRGGESYTIDTVRSVYSRYRFEGRPSLIIGSDLLRELHTWRNIEELCTLVHFIVMRRYPQSSGESIPADIPGLSWETFSGRRIDVTSSEIRERRRSGGSVRYLVPDGVYDYIIRNKLYGPAHEP